MLPFLILTYGGHNQGPDFKICKGFNVGQGYSYPSFGHHWLLLGIWPVRLTLPLRETSNHKQSANNMCTQVKAFIYSASAVQTVLPWQEVCSVLMCNNTYLSFTI